MKITTVNTRGWHWALTDAAHHVNTGEILWLMRREKLDVLLLSDVHTASSGRFNTSHTTVALEEFVMIVGKMSSIILSPAAQAAWRETGYERWECKETGRMVAVALLIAGSALPRADHEGCNRRTPSGQIRGTVGTARSTWLRHCIRSSQPVLRSYQPARCTPYSRGGKNCISPPAQAPEPERRGRQAMGVDIGVGPVSVISNNQRCRDCSLVRCKSVGDQVATSIESGRPSCKTACCTHQRQRQGQGERKKQSTLRQPRPRRRTKQQQEETERRLVGLSRRLVATRHDGVLFNQCYFMSFLDKQSHEVCCEGPPPSGPLRARWRCEVASGPLGGAAEVAHGGSPRHSQQLGLFCYKLPGDGQLMAYISSNTFYNELWVAPEEHPVFADGRPSKPQD